MSSGIFFLSSVKDSKLSNGNIIRYGNKLYLVGCAHSFFQRKSYSINFLVNPSIRGTQINADVYLKNLSFPEFHPDDTVEYTNEISLFELDSTHESKLKKQTVPIYNLESKFKQPKKDEELIFKGYNAGIASNPNFQGKIDENEFNLGYLDFKPFIDSDFNNLLKKTMNNHILKLSKDSHLGDGYSGSSILSKKDEQTLKGIYFASSTELKGHLRNETKNGCAIFTGADKIIETIEGEV